MALDCKLWLSTMALAWIVSLRIIQRQGKCSAKKNVLLIVG
jgi:hypothetical protein